MTVSRAALRWHGGKWRLAPWILANMPKHRVYVEPFGGAASVLLRKPRSYAEIYNDLDDEVVNFFEVLRDVAMSDELERRLRLTPFARAEFKKSFASTDDPIEKARRLIVRSYMGFGSNAHATPERGRWATGFRGSSNRSGTTPAHDWKSYPDSVVLFSTRMQGVVIESRDAREIMAKHDGVRTLHYVDPPYLHETRARGNKYDLEKRMYKHELTRDNHVELLEFVDELDGMVMLAGYPDALYDDALTGWRRITIKAFADGAREREEVMWLNPACVDALNNQRAGHDTPLFREENA